MKPWTVASAAALVFVVGGSGCERREPPPGETRTRSGELNGEPRRAGETPAGDRDDRARDDRARDAGPRATRDAGPRAPRDAGAARGGDAAAEDPRLDAGRLSIVGSAEERERNLGLIRTPAIAPVEGVEVTAPEQRDAAAVEGARPPPASPASPAPPLKREGAGRPGAAGDPYQ